MRCYKTPAASTARALNMIRSGMQG